MTAVMTVLMLLAGPSAADPIPAAKARDHVGEKGTFEMVARHTNDGTHEKSYFLDSEKDYKDAANLAVVISYDHLKAFKEAGIDDPAKHYRGKRLRVTGKVIHEADQTRIRVTAPEQIEVVAEK